MLHTAPVRDHTLRLILGAAICALLVLLTCAEAASAQGLKASHAAHPLIFTRIDVRGASLTSAIGINAAGDIVGTYVDTQSVRHGFLLRKGKVTTIDYPGAVMTEAHGVNATGEIVGYYRLKGEPDSTYHGFLRHRNRTFRSLDFGGHYSAGLRILDDGTILGCRHDGKDMMASMRGVAFTRKGNVESDLVSSMHTGATPNLKRVVGMYTNMKANDRMEGYIIEDGVFTPLLVPGSMMTVAWDVNRAGTVVGVYRNATGFHGFVMTGGEYDTIDAPAAEATRAYGINAGGAVVGQFVAGGKTHGFLAKRAAEN